MSEEHEARQRCCMTNKFITWNSFITSAQCDKEINDENETSDDINQDYSERNEIITSNERQRKMLQ